VLGNSIASYLFERYPDENEGFLTRMRTKLVNGKMLGKLCKIVGLDKYILLSKQIEDKTHHDFYVFGHRHTMAEINISDSARYVNLGDWIWHNSYAVFDGKTMQLLNYQTK
jgi:UDP-2,3-diacylglucosamine hydrolase